MSKDQTLDKQLRNLSIAGSGSKSKQKAELADSWEEDASDHESRPSKPANQPQSPQSPTHTEDYPSAPPPTPASPTQAAHSFARSTLTNSRGTVTSPSRLTPDAEKRPETSTATASRLIAAGLGLRAPKRTEEERKYDRAIKENEIRKKAAQREQQRLQEEAREKAKKDIWGD